MSDLRLQSVVEQETQQAISVIKQMASALRGTKLEMWYLAQQAGVDWKDKEWRKRSSVGRAHDKAENALKLAEPYLRK